MKTGLFCIFCLTVAVFLVAAAPLAHSLTIIENFDNYVDGNLSFKVAPNGETWGPYNIGASSSSLVINTDPDYNGPPEYNVEGRKSVGNSNGPFPIVPSPPAGQWFTNSLPIGETLTSGVYRLEAYLYKAAPDYFNSTGWLHVGLRDSWSGNTVGVGWAGNYTQQGDVEPWLPGNVYLDGSGIDYWTSHQSTGTFAAGWIHVTLTVDLNDYPTLVTATWEPGPGYEPDPLHPSGAFSTKIAPLYVDGFEPDEITIVDYINTPTYYYKGVDNIKLTDVATGNLTGVVTFEDAPGLDLAITPVRISLLKNGGAVRTVLVTLGGDRRYTINGLVADTYDVAFEAAGFLRRIENGVVVPAGATSDDCSPWLSNGDVDHNNTVSAVEDLAAVIKNLQ